MAENPRPAPEPADQPPSSPYGPQRGHVDQSAGGADSSPLEGVPDGQKRDAARERREQAGSRE